jgi:hypothetical protein
MGITKEKLIDYLLLLSIAIFSIGQLPGIFFQNLLSLSFRIHPIDVISIFIVVFIASNIGISKLSKKYWAFLVVLVFSVSVGNALKVFDLVGLFYLARIASYIPLIYLLPKLKTNTKQLALGMLIAVMLAAFFGWFQYLFFPDLTELKNFGWDDHYYRLVSTFLDPAFTGIVFALSATTSLSLFLKSKSKVYLFSFIFLFVSLAFTYSRASYLAFSVGMLILFWQKHKKYMLSILAALILIVLILPNKMGGEGVNLLRTSSAVQKLKNFSDSYEIISHSPLFGVGFNNLCTAKAKLSIPTGTNSCYGLDNTFLFVWATTGVTGLIIFINLLFDLYKNNKSILWRASLGMVIIHSMFTPTIFFPWVLFYLAVLNSVSLNSEG